MKLIVDLSRQDLLLALRKLLPSSFRGAADRRGQRAGSPCERQAGRELNPHMADLLVVILVADAGEDARLQTREDQEQHALEVVGESGLRACLLQPDEGGLASDDALSHRLIGLAPRLTTVEVVEEQLVDTDRSFLSKTVTKCLDQELHAFFGWLPFGSLGARLGVVELPHSFSFVGCVAQLG